MCLQPLIKLKQRLTKHKRRTLRELMSCTATASHQRKKSAEHYNTAARVAEMARAFQRYWTRDPTAARRTSTGQRNKSVFHRGSPRQSVLPVSSPKDARFLDRGSKSHCALLEGLLFIQKLKTAQRLKLHKGPPPLVDQGITVVQPPTDRWRCRQFDQLPLKLLKYLQLSQEEEEEVEENKTEKEREEKEKEEKRKKDDTKEKRNSEENKADRFSSQKKLPLVKAASQILSSTMSSKVVFLGKAALLSKRPAAALDTVSSANSDKMAVASRGQLAASATSGRKRVNAANKENRAEQDGASCVDWLSTRTQTTYPSTAGKIYPKHVLDARQEGSWY